MKFLLKALSICCILMATMTFYGEPNRAEASCYPVKSCNTKPKNIKLGTTITISKTYTKSQLKKNKTIAKALGDGATYIGIPVIGSFASFSALTAGATAAGAGAIGAATWTVTSISNSNVKKFNDQIKKIKKGHTKLKITKTYKYQWAYESFGNSSVRKVKKYVLVGQPTYQSLK